MSTSTHKARGVSTWVRGADGVLEERIVSAQPAAPPSPTPKTGVDTAAILHQLDTEARKQLGSTFTQADYITALEAAVDALTGEPDDTAPDGTPLSGQDVVRRANAAMRADGLSPNTASPATVSRYYALASEESEPEALPTSGEDADVVARAICLERGQNPDDYEAYASALEEADRLIARGEALTEAKRLVARASR